MAPLGEGAAAPSAANKLRAALTDRKGALVSISPTTNSLGEPGCPFGVAKFFGDPSPTDLNGTTLLLSLSPNELGEAAVAFGALPAGELTLFWRVLMLNPNIIFLNPPAPTTINNTLKT